MTTTLDLLFSGLRQRRQQHADALEELGARVAHGEHVPPDEAQAFLDRARATEDDLAPVVARHQERLRLKKRIQDGRAAEKKLVTIDRKVAEANDKVAAAVAARDKLVSLTWEEAILLRQKVQRGNAAVDELIAPTALSPTDVDRLAAARDAAIAANEAAHRCGQRLVELRQQLKDADERVDETAAAVRLHKRCETTANAHERAKNRRERLKRDVKTAEGELPALKRDAEAADAVVAKLEAELRAT